MKHGGKLACPQFAALYTHIYIYVYIQAHTHTHTSIYIYIYTSIHTHTYLYLYIYKYLYVHVYIHRSIYLYTHTPMLAEACTRQQGTPYHHTTGAYTYKNTRSATGHAQYTTLPLLWFSHSLLACCPGFYLFAPFVLSPPRGALVVLPRPVLVLL